MAMRAVQNLCKGGRLTVRQFTASRSCWEEGATPVRGPGALGNVSGGTKDMESGDRESVTEGSESPRDIADTMAKHDDAGKTDSAQDELKGKPVAQAGVEQVREDLAGSQP